MLSFEKCVRRYIDGPATAMMRHGAPAFGYLVDRVRLGPAALVQLMSTGRKSHEYNVVRLRTPLSSVNGPSDGVFQVMDCGRECGFTRKSIFRAHSYVAAGKPYSFLCPRSDSFPATPCTISRLILLRLLFRNKGVYVWWATRPSRVDDIICLLHISRCCKFLCTIRRPRLA